MQRRAWVVATMALAAVVGGCSDDGGETAGEPSAPETSTGAASEGATDDTGAGANEAVRVPEVTGPVLVGDGVSFIGTDVASAGYVQEEYFIEGTASAYEPVGELDSDGRWHVAEGRTAPYRTRLLVWRPADAAAFNGTVFVEWFNVSAGFDNAPDWLMAHNQIVRDGAAWIGVSAQAVGVEGGDGFDVAIALPPLKEADPERYGSLEHPGDAFSYDIFTQTGVAAVGDGQGVDPLDGYDVEQVIAMGESQSAFRLTTYVNAVHPLAGVYDGYLLHSRRGGAASFGDQALGEDAPEIPEVVRIRDDLDVPVLTFQTESELTLLDFAPARQPDTDRFRLWEVAGTAHVDAYAAGPALADLGDGGAEAALLDPARVSGGPLGCSEPINAGGQHAVLMAALAHLDRWVRDGTPPPEAPRIETTGDGTQIVRNELGIAEGGVRTPIVDVPLAANDGEANAGGDTCRLFGRTRPLDAATLAQLYPGGRADYDAAFDQAADAALDAGFWLAPEAENYKAAARQIPFG